MIKRLLDLALSLAAITLLSPVLIMVFLLVRIKLGSPVLFKQIRPGLNAKLFEMQKFRTMTDERDADGNLLPDDQRLSRFGSFLRSTSLDELPALWNVIKGDMSLVGPRPLLVEYLSLYNDRQARRHDLKPGITGWAQINGRNTIDWEQKFELDIWYVENQSFWLDIKILFLTIFKVFQREGISHQNHVTMEKFEGSK